MTDAEKRRICCFCERWGSGGIESFLNNVLCRLDTSSLELDIVTVSLETSIDGIPFTWKFLLLVYPVGCLIVFNLGVGLILSALFVFFRDMQYLWGILTQLIMWMSAIFYTIDGYSYTVQCAFLLNPLYLFIRYFRKIVIDGTIPTLQFHLLAAGYALAALGVGAYMYKKYNHEFLYYV